MTVIEDFNLLSEEEQIKFAEDLVAKINAEHLFTSEVNWVLNDVWANEQDGNLEISLIDEEGLDLELEATWQCGDEDEAERDPGHDVADIESAFSAATYYFKDTTPVTVDGYTLTLEVTDAEAGDTVEVYADEVSEEDDGIGWYDHFGYQGYDSRPYIEVSGRIVKNCSVGVQITVAPAAAEFERAEAADAPVEDTTGEDVLEEL